MSAVLWTADDIALATGGRANAPFDAYGLSIDTRTLKPGDLFVALADQRDGHDFVGAADAAGAAGALVSQPVDGERPRIVVSDVLKALEALAIAARARSGAVRCAVTGSVGKTSVKEMLAQIFKAAAPAHWPERSFNNHWGVPLTLARTPAETARAIFEIGMSTPGEIAPRSRLVRPHHALITKIAPAHLEGVGSIEGVAEEKADIFAGLEAHGTIMVPEDDRFRDFLATKGRTFAPSADVLSFGKGDTATARLMGVDSDGFGSVARVKLDGAEVAISLRAVGEHWGLNAAAALLTAWRTGITPQDAAAALEGFGPPPGRGTAETLVLPDGTAALLIDDAYNANPESMQAALAALAERPGARKLAALGEMLEIGAGSDAAHAQLAEPIERAKVSEVFLAGAAMTALKVAQPDAIGVRQGATALDVAAHLKNTLRDGDTLLIKGSNASGMGKLVEELRHWSRENQRAMDAAQNGSRGV